MSTYKKLDWVYYGEKRQPIRKGVVIDVCEQTDRCKIQPTRDWNGAQWMNVEHKKPVWIKLKNVVDSFKGSMDAWS